MISIKGMALFFFFFFDTFTGFSVQKPPAEPSLSIKQNDKTMAH